MNIKTGILAAAAALTLAVPAAALAQPSYGEVPGYRTEYRTDIRDDQFRRGDFRRDDFRRDDYRRDEWRRFDREREFRRLQDLRRLRWEREREFRDYGNGYR